MGRLDGKVAVITGGNSGVGAATAKLFAKEGATVVITARREAALKEVADEITAAGGEVYAVSTDISKPEDPEALMQKVMDKYGKIDILVNNAGILEQGLKPIDRFLDEDMDRIRSGFVSPLPLHPASSEAPCHRALYEEVQKPFPCSCIC